MNNKPNQLIKLILMFGICIVTIPLSLFLSNSRILKRIDKNQAEWEAKKIRMRNSQ